MTESGAERPEYTMAEAAADLAKEAGVTIAGFALPAGTPMIHALIVEAMRQIGAVEKLGEYNQGGTQYKYRSVDAVVNAVGPALRKVGIYPLPVVQEVARAWGATASGSPRRETIVRATYRFTAPDGSYVEVVLECENWSTTDKGSGVAMSVLYRIALLQLFCIPTGDPDPDASYPESGTAPRLTKPLVAYLVNGIDKGPLGDLESLRNLLVAHAPEDSRVPEEDTQRVWWEVFAERYTREVEARHSKDDLAALWKELGAFGLGYLIGGGRSVADLIKERNALLVREHQAAVKECRDVIADADEAAALDHAREVVRVHLTNHRISSADSLMFLDQLATRADQIKQAEAQAAAQALGDPDENYDGEGGPSGGND